MFSTNLIKAVHISCTLILLLNLINIQISFGEEPPDSLWNEQVDAIILFDESEFQAKQNNTGKLKLHRKVLINNLKGRKYGNFTIHENKYIEIKKITGKIQDLTGKELKKLNKNDIIKGDISESYVLYDDLKFQRVELEWHSFPYIVDYEYELDYKSLYYWPDWSPQEEVPVLASTYRLIIKPGLTYNYYPIGIEIDPTIIKCPDNEIHTWKLVNIEPFEKEDWMPPESRDQNTVRFAPLRFRLDDYEGSFESWAHFANWYHRLVYDKYYLTDEIKSQIRDMISEVETDKEKVKLLYRFLQQYTRYVAIELGLGGHQPSNAKLVCKNKYGDCKDLSNFFIAMAKEVGISAHPVLIRTRDKGIVYTDFPADYFNHVIVHIPLRKDTLWIECTSDHLAAGDLPPMDEGCTVLVIKENGSSISSTPVSTPLHNQTISKTTGVLLNSGAFLMQGHLIYTGNNAYFKRSILVDKSSQDRLTWILNSVLEKYCPETILETLSYENLTESFDKPVILNYKGEFRKFAVKTSNRIFFNPNILQREVASDIPKEKTRKFPVNYYYPYMTIDTVIIKLPSGYTMEAMPDMIDLETNFGFYKTYYTLENNELTHIRKLQINQKLIMPVDYDVYYNFIKTAVKTDGLQFVLKK